MHQVKAMEAQKQGAKCRAAWSSGGLEQWNQAMKQKYPQADQWMEHWGRCEDVEPVHGRCNDGAPLVQDTGSSKAGDTFSVCCAIILQLIQGVLKMY